MSKIFAELQKATGHTVDPKNAAEMKKMILAVGNDLTEKAWGGLSNGAQDWYNEAADAMNEKKPIPAFPDAEADEPPATPRRRAAAAEPEKETPPAKKDEKPSVEKLAEGDRVKVTTKRREVTGTVVENDAKKELLAVKDDETGKEREFDYDEITELEVFHGTAGAGSEPDAGPAEPAVGDQVRLTNKRGKEFEGRITEMTDAEITIDVGDGELEDFDLEKVTSIEVITKGKSKPAAADDKPAASRRSAPKDDDKGKGKDDDDAGDEKKRSSNPKGVSVGGRIRELMCEDRTITQDAISKVLKKEGIEFRDASLNMIFKDTTKVFEELAKNGAFKK